MSLYEFRRGAPRQDHKRAILASMLCFASLLLFRPQMRAAQTPASTLGQQPVIGRLSGDDVSVTGAAGFENENGRQTALLASGSTLTLRSGQAKIDLPEEGDIILCGPAHLSILKSGEAITIALDYGQVHLQVRAAAQVTIYTPLLVVTPAAIGERQRDLTVGLDEKGELCVTALSGATRIEEQFSAESVIVPQGGEINIVAGELRTLRNGSGKCSCELLVSQNSSQKQIELSVPAHPSADASKAPRAPEPANPPTYRIDMPPLTFDASSPNPPPVPSTEAMLIIRESVADPQISFRGAVRPVLPPPPSEVSRSKPQSHNPKSSFFARLFGLFHHRKGPPSEQSAAVR